MKFDILHRHTGKAIFTAEIDVDEKADRSIKLSLAVKIAVKEDADLRGANLRGADLPGADLRDANLCGANLRGADLPGANLCGANLRDADLWNADLQDADLRGADLRGADLQDADLWGADLQDANLQGANLRGANLRDANLCGANLRNAKNAVIPIPIGCVGEGVRTGYAIWYGKKVMVRLGCFYGDEKKAIAAVSEKYGPRSGYAMMVKAACKVAKERKVLNPTDENRSK